MKTVDSGKFEHVREVVQNHIEENAIENKRDYRTVMSAIERMIERLNRSKQLLEEYALLIKEEK